MSVCQPCPASGSPICLPSLTTLERIMTSGRPGSWCAPITLISRSPKRALKFLRSAAVRLWLGKRITPRRPSAWTTASASASDRWARSSPSSVAPSDSPEGITLIGIAPSPTHSRLRAHGNDRPGNRRRIFMGMMLLLWNWTGKEEKSLRDITLRR